MSYHILKKNKYSQSFTLIELLVVIAIIGILSSIVLVSLNSAKAKARDARRISDFRQIQTALEMFYGTYGRYPQSPGYATWEGHWYNFSQCLETGVNCGFAISNYVPVMSQVPQDPLQPTPDNPDDGGVTYIPAYPTGCTDGQSYRLAVNLEANNSVLSSDLDGSSYNNNGGCNEDSTNFRYCVGVGSCAGW